MFNVESVWVSGYFSWVWRSGQGQRIPSFPLPLSLTSLSGSSVSSSFSSPPPHFFNLSTCSTKDRPPHGRHDLVRHQGFLRNNIVWSCITQVPFRKLSCLSSRCVIPDPLPWFKCAGLNSGEVSIRSTFCTDLKLTVDQGVWFFHGISNFPYVFARCQVVFWWCRAIH